MLIDNEENVFTNLDEGCKQCVAKCPIGYSSVETPKCGGGKRKRYLEQSGKKELYFCSGDKNSIKSNRLFKSKVNVFKSFLPLIENIKQDITKELNKENKRLFHNVISLNAHNIQELYAFVNQNILTYNIGDQRRIIRQTIEEDLDNATNMFLRIAKNNSSMKTEFAVFKKLVDTNPTLSVRRHNVKKVLLNVLHVFFEDFTSKSINVIIQDCEEFVYFDYESIHVVLYHLLDNAVKYCLEESKLYINFETNETTNTCDIIFDMLSIEIRPEEISRIKNDGYSGVNAKKLGKSGDGVGMYIISRLLKLNKAEFILDPNKCNRLHRNGVYYTKNLIKIRVSKTDFSS